MPKPQGGIEDHECPNAPHHSASLHSASHQGMKVPSGACIESVLITFLFDQYFTWRLFIANAADIPIRESVPFSQRNTAYIFHYFLLKDFALLLDWLVVLTD